jgi:nicotinamide phosphoribosyltransferase
MLIKIPTLLDVDSYKEGHPIQRPKNIKKITAYYTHRGNTLFKEDNRIIFYGMRWMYESFLDTPITMEDVHEADEYLKTHGVGATPYEWPRDLFIKIIEENQGYWPVTIRSLRDGQCVHPGVPCFTISAKAPYEGLTTYLETRLMRIWSPSCTATKSAIVRDILQEAFDKTVDPEFHFLLDSRFHDFGSRGTSSAETAMVTSTGHLLFFEGTDTMSAGWLATKWNNGIGIGQSVVATEHSVMTVWDTELNAVINLINQAPKGAILSVVADSYNYLNFLQTILPEVVTLCRAKEIFFVVRPDSGDTVESVTQGLYYLDKVFGSFKNSLGYKVINGAGVIQGDGLTLESLKEIVNATKYLGYSAQCIAYGMGGGLLQKQDRDTLKVAIKVCEIETNDGKVHPIMKKPSMDITKISLPGDFSLTVFPSGGDLNIQIDPLENPWGPDNMLEVIWDCGPVNYEFETFNFMRIRARESWNSCTRYNESLSDSMKEKLMKVQETLNK